MSTTETKKERKPRTPADSDKGLLQKFVTSLDAAEAKYFLHTCRKIWEGDMPAHSSEFEKELYAAVKELIHAPAAGDKE
jgi:hypothetical protein